MAKKLTIEPFKFNEQFRVDAHDIKEDDENVKSVKIAVVKKCCDGDFQMAEAAQFSFIFFIDKNLLKIVKNALY